MTAPTSAVGAALSWNAIDLGPELPMSVFTSTERWHPERIGALALYCSDGRWGEAFDEFCHRHLQIPRYDRWAVPGGPACLIPHDDCRGFALTVWDQLDFLIRVHELGRIVLITHYGCAYYGHRLQQSPHDCLAVQNKEVLTAAVMLRKSYPAMRVEAYLAMRTGSCLSFHQLDG